MSIIETILQHSSPGSIAIAVLVVLTALYTVNWVVEDIKIRRLGGYTRRSPTWIPFGLGFIVTSVQGTLKHKNLEVWDSWFSTPKGYTYTCEATPAGRRCIFTADPENIKAILATQFTDYGKGKPFHRDWKDFLGDSIFTTDLDQWHDSRHLIRPQFIKDRVSDLGIFEEHVQILIKEIQKASKTYDGKQGKSFDISDLFFRYTLDAATHFLLGNSAGSLENEQLAFAYAFGEVQRVQNIIARAGPMNKLVPRGSFYKQLKILNEFVEPYIEQALQLSPEELEGKSKSDEGYSFLHALAGFTRDRKVLRDQIVAVLLAGRDTTASTLSWTFYELARHPEIVQKLRQEIIQQVGLERPPTYSDLKSMKYLQNVMHETLRLYPSVPFNVRLALKDTTLPRGGGPDGLSPVGVLKDTPIGYSTIVMQRRPDLTDNVEAFSPERWETWQPKPWQYIPFNGGPRICIGQQFALTEMGYTLVKLFQKFDRLELNMEEIDQGSPQLKAEIVLQPGQGVFVSLFEGEKQ